MPRFGDSIVSTNPNQEFSSMSLNTMQDVVSAVQHILSMVGVSSSSGNDPHGNIREQLNYLMAEVRATRTSTAVSRDLSSIPSPGNTREEIARLNRRIQLLETQRRVQSTVFSVPRMLSIPAVTAVPTSVYEYAKGCVELAWTDIDGNVYTGSGWLYQYNGVVYIVTAAHCGMIHTAPQDTYGTFPSRYSQTMSATIHITTDENTVVKTAFPVAVVAADARADLMIAVPYVVDGTTDTSFNASSMLTWQGMYGSRVTSLSFGSSRNVIPGTTCYTIGNPENFDSFSISRGVVRDNKLVHSFGIETFFADVSASPGNSGGPIISGSGQVWGLLSFSYDSNTMVGGIAQYIMEPLVKKMASYVQYTFADGRFNGPYENEKATLGIYIEVVKTSTLASAMHAVTQTETPNTDHPVYSMFGGAPTGVLVASTANSNFNVGDVITRVTYRPNDPFDPNYNNDAPGIVQTIISGNVQSMMFRENKLALGLADGSVHVYSYVNNTWTSDSLDIPSPNEPIAAITFGSTTDVLLIGHGQSVSVYDITDEEDASLSIGSSVQDISVVNERLVAVVSQAAMYLVNLKGDEESALYTLENNVRAFVYSATASLMVTATASQVTFYNLNPITTQAIHTIVVTVRNGQYYLNGTTQPITLQHGTYLFTNIPDDHPMAIIDMFDDTALRYAGDGGNSVERVFNGVRYYTGNMLVYVTGLFGHASLHCQYHEYMGGQNRLQYLPATMSGPLPDLQKLVLSPNQDTLVAVGGADTQTVYGLDTNTGEGAALLTHTSAIESLAFSPNSRFFAVGGGDQVALFDTFLLTTLWTHELGSGIRSIAFPSDTTLAVGGSNGVTMYSLEQEDTAISIGNDSECLSNALWFINAENASSAQITVLRSNSTETTVGYTYEALSMDKDVFLTDILTLKEDDDKRSWM